MHHGLIQFEGVWKKFRRGERHDSLRDLLPALVRGMARRRPVADLESQEFWALEDVSFSIAPGEALGLIGPNGAGKSTILKILTRLIRPTRGLSRVRGRIGSLIEIGGSLHPDLTGRENVFLQGSVMGMSRAEITRKFDEIVAFAGLPDFIDTPVKRYSSGMSARLGFAVAAHLETDVMIIDEVLAVGDSGFQRKAFERMQAMVNAGIPAIVVSHQLDRITTLCRRAILLVRGRMAHEGPAAECIEAYARHQASAGVPPSAAESVRLDSITNESSSTVASGDRVRVRIAGVAPPDRLQARKVVGVRVRSLQTGSIVYASGTEAHHIELAAGPFELDVELEMNVSPGVYAIESSVWQWQREVDAVYGPTAIVQVHGGPSFWGSVQLKSVMRLRVPAIRAPVGS
jgi:lipopolysaccharide transport system ATP-binding protein